MIRIEIPGKPIAKARPRFCRVGKGVKTYDVQTTESGKWMLLAKEQIHDTPSEEPISLICYFYMPRPLSHYGTGKNRNKLKPASPINHITKPDLDNLVKFVKDCLNGIAWRDDSQVIELSAIKMYDRNPRTIVEIHNFGHKKTEED